MNPSNPVNIVIVGGVAAGMSAATRARRMNESAGITVFEKGQYVSFANCGLPYFLARQIKTSDKLLVTTPEKLHERFNLDVRTNHEVMRIDRAAKTIEVRDSKTGQIEKTAYDKLILAPGAEPIVPPIAHVEAENVFLLRSMENTLAVDEYLTAKAPKRAVIVGAGFIGLEMSEAMRARGLEVTVVEKSPHALPPLDVEMAASIGEELARNSVTLIAGTGLTSLQAHDNKVSAVQLEDGRVIETDLVLLSIGVRPNTRLAKEAGLTLGDSGAIAVDEFQRTSDLDIYAVGDVAEVMHGVTGKRTRIPLAGPANRHGRLAGEHAATGKSARAGAVFGTAIVRVFDLSVGLTGLSERDARRANIDIDTGYVLPAHHASYFPGAEPMRIKLIWERATGRIIGAQAVGKAGVDKRIDVIATAMHFHGTIDDLSDLDLAYAPQFGSAKDAIHLAAFVARNQREGSMPAIAPNELDGELLLDVRSAEEFARGTLRGAINIPLDDLRGRLSELDPMRPTIAFCQVGLRGYVAQRILQQSGFNDVRNLKGGYSLALTMPGTN